MAILSRFTTVMVLASLGTLAAQPPLFPGDALAGWVPVGPGVGRVHVQNAAGTCGHIRTCTVSTAVARMQPDVVQPVISRVSTPAAVSVELSEVPKKALA